LDAAGRPGLKQGPGEFGKGGEIKKEGCNEKGIRWKKETRKELVRRKGSEHATKISILIWKGKEGESKAKSEENQSISRFRKKVCGVTAVREARP
jgi:hypothetical protein